MPTGLEPICIGLPMTKNLYMNPYLHLYLCSQVRTCTHTHDQESIGEPAPISSHIPRVVLIGGLPISGWGKCKLQIYGGARPLCPCTHLVSAPRCQEPLPIILWGCPSPPPPGYAPGICAHMSRTRTRTHDSEPIRKWQTHTCTSMCAQVQYPYVYP